MSSILKEIQAKQLENRKLALELKSEPQKSRAKLLTYFLGELERVYKLDSITDKEVISKLKNVADSLPDADEQEYLRSFMPSPFTEAWHESYVDCAMGEGVMSIPDLMKRVKADEDDGVFDKIVDKKLLNKIMQNRLTGKSRAV